MQQESGFFLTMYIICSVNSKVLSFTFDSAVLRFVNYRYSFFRLTAFLFMITFCYSIFNNLASSCKRVQYNYFRCILYLLNTFLFKSAYISHWLRHQANCRRRTTNVATVTITY